MPIYIFTMVCPRCDRPYTSSTSLADALELVKTHVRGQHPDHDSAWFESYPEAIPSDFSNYRQGDTP